MVYALMPVIGFSQNEAAPTKQRLFLGINAGLNSSKFCSDTIDFSYGVKPALGLYADYALFKAVYLKTDVLYSVKGSTSNGFYMKWENHYLDADIISRFQFSHDFYLQCGAGYSQFFFSQRIRPSGETKSGSKRFDNGKFISELSIVSGLGVKLRKNSSIEFNYFIPVLRKGTRNFRLSFHIPLNDKNRKVTRTKINRDRAKEQIADLKDGTLLVRLKTSENKINALLKSGKTEEADRVRQKQEIENKKIVFAFRHHYNFSEVLFFYSRKSGEIRRKEFAEIFLNDSLMTDPSITVDKNKSIFIAEFASVEQDTAKYISRATYQPDGNWTLKKQNHYYGGPNPGFDALIIRDENFVQLRKPFPYYTRAIFNSIKEHPEQTVFLSFPVPIVLFQNWSYDKTVRKMNLKLEKYYKKVSKTFPVQ